MRSTKPGDMRTVACLSNPKYIFCTGDDALAVCENIGGKTNGCEYNSFFIYAKDGEYVEVWGMAGIVPYLSKLVYRLI